MSIEDVAVKADVWSEAVKKIVKAISAAVVAFVAGISGLMMLWPDGEPTVPSELITGGGYTVQCSQFMNTIDITWTEQQWSVWEQLRKGMDC